MENYHDEAVATVFDLLDNAILGRFPVPWRTTVMLSPPHVTSSSFSFDRPQLSCCPPPINSAPVAAARYQRAR
jgi:hypothetical protein